MVEAGNRNFLQDIETFRGGFGLEGGLGPQWSWEVYWSWAQNKAISTTEGLLNTDAIRKALGPASGCTGSCVPLNIFGGQGTDAQYDGEGRWSGSGSITEAMLNYISFTAHDTGGNDMKNMNAQLTGTVTDLPAGPVGVAFGYEYREESGFTSPDALIVTGATSGNASQPTSGSYDVTELFAEVQIPLLSGAQFAETLDANIALRYSDYSSFGSTTNGKYNLMWRPHNDLLLRITLSDGFRAPSVPSMFSVNPTVPTRIGSGTASRPMGVNSDNFTTPMSKTNSAMSKRWRCQMVSSTQYARFDIQRVGGNPALCNRRV